MKTRIAGLDVARAIAILGMVYNHLGPYSGPAHTMSSGYPSALFAVLAGFSLCLMTARGNAAGGEELLRGRYRLLIRGVIIAAIGIVLTMVQSYIVVVLSAIAAILLLLGPVTRWRTRDILWLLAGVAILGTAVQKAAGRLGVHSEFLTGSYPVFTWLAFGMVGILGYRYLLDDERVQAIAAVVGLGVGAAALSARDPMVVHEQTGTDGTVDGEASETFLAAWLSVEPHSGALGDLLVSALASIGVVSLCLLLCRADLVVKLLYPLRALGSMALTAYVAHCLTATLLLSGFFGLIGGVEKQPVPAQMYDIGMTEETLGGLPWQEYQDLVATSPGWQELWDAEAEAMGAADDATEPEPEVDYGPFALWTTVIGLLVFASLWKLWFARGPLEAGVRSIERRLIRPTQL